MGNYNSPAIMLAIEMYRRSEASIKRASNIAGVSRLIRRAERRVSTANYSRFHGNDQNGYTSQNDNVTIFYFFGQ